MNRSAFVIIFYVNVTFANILFDQTARRSCLFCFFFRLRPCRDLHVVTLRASRSASTSVSRIWCSKILTSSPLSTCNTRTYTLLCAKISRLFADYSITLCLFGWRRGSVVRTSVCSRRTFPDLRLIYGWRMITLWVRRPLWVNQLGQVSLSSLWGR